MLNRVLFWTFVSQLILAFQYSATDASSDSNSRNFNSPQLGSIFETYNSPQTKRVPRFSFFREFIEPLPGVLNDIFPSFSFNDPVVRTENGLLRGTIKESRDGRKYYAFLGVAYANPPVRFEPPQKLTEKWDGVKDATNYGPACFHMDTFVTGRLNGEENCLFVNVYTPKLRKNLSVMVYIHGGGFTYGSGDFYQAKYMMDEDVVLVVFNYRLSALGFLETEDGLIRGNNALRDQLMLLKYVRNNIKAFGGDPTKITIFGESAGAAMVQYHTLSKPSQGLFHKAIALSGSALSPWAFAKNPARSAKRLAKYAGCPTNSSLIMVKCLKSASLHDIAKDYANMLDAVTNPADYYAPTIETVLSDDTMIFEHPEKTLSRGNFTKVPMMLGVNSMEGFIFSSRILADRYAKKNMGKYFNKWIPELLAYDHQNTTTSALLKSLYFENDKIDLSKTEDFIRLTQLLSDGTFFYPNHRFAEQYKDHAPTYLYYNTYQGRMSVHDIISKVSFNSDNLNAFPELAVGTGIFSDLMRYSLTNERPSNFGASHGDFLMLVFNLRRTPGIGRLSMDYEMSKTLVKALVDFASSTDEDAVFYNGIPWPKLTPKSSLKYMNLETAEIIDEPMAERMNLWNSKFPIN